MVNYSAMVACHSQTDAVYWQTHTHNACTNKHTCFMCVYTRTHARNSEICSQNTFCHLHRCTSKDKHLPKCKCSRLAVALFWRRRCWWGFGSIPLFPLLVGFISPSSPSPLVFNHPKLLWLPASLSSAYLTSWDTLCVCVCMLGQRRTSYPLELEVQAVVNTHMGDTHTHIH